MQNCARPWSIRLQRPRCSASSAARRQTCSRSSMPSSKAPPGFVGLMTWCCDSTEGNTMVPRAHFGPIPIDRTEINIDEPHFRWMREHGTLHIPDVPRAERFPNWWAIPVLRTYLSFPFVSRGNSLDTGRTSHRGAPLHPGADQATRNLRRPGGDRHRERAAVPRTQGVVGAANCDE